MPTNPMTSPKNQPIPDDLYSLPAMLRSAIKHATPNMDAPTAAVALSKT